MRIIDIIGSYVGNMTLDESDSFISEMANFLADVTDLPANIVLWTKPQPEMLPHDKYRMKVFKDRIHVATYSISSHPTMLWNTGRKTLALTSDETTEVIEVIHENSSIFIQLVDGKLTTDGVKYEIKKKRGAK